MSKVSSVLARLLPASLASFLAVACTTTAEDSRTEVHAYVMASCPFSADAMTQLLQSKVLRDRAVKLEVDYVAAVDESGVHSPYGEADLLAARAQLCAHADHPEDKWLAYLSCAFSDLGKGSKTPAFCAAKAEIPWPALEACATGSRGQQLLRASVQESIAAHVQAAPEVFIADKRHAQARTTSLLTRAICDAMSGERPVVCTQLPEPVAVAVTLVSASCAEPPCGDTRFSDFLNYTLEAPQILEVDAESALGQRAIAAAGVGAPFALFDLGIEQEAAAFERLKAAGMRPIAAHGYVLPLSSTQGAKL